MTEVKVTKDRYVTDSLYQYDKNQELVIFGLSLPSIPEIHFSNSLLNEAIVKQARMDEAGVVYVDIPNEILTYSNDIDVYVCIYEGDAFKVLYKFAITVKARTKPADYIADDDEKIYSYNALENKLENTLVLSLERYDEVNQKYEDVNDKYNQALETLEESIKAHNESEETFNAGIEEVNQAKKSAQTSAENASKSAQESANSATSASNSAKTATDKASEAKTSATNASKSETNASASAESASDSANEAKTAQTLAEKARDEAEYDLKIEVANQLDGAKADIVLELISQIGGLPVFGTVDDYNVIKVTSMLADGEYIVKYENEDGAFETIGTIVVSVNGVSYINLADPTSSDWLTNKRLKSGGTIVDNAGSMITNYIECVLNNTVRIQGLKLNSNLPTSNTSSQIEEYDASGTRSGYYFVAQTLADGTATNFTYDEDTDTLTYIVSKSDTAKIRICGTTPADVNDVIITVNQEIK